VFDGSVYSFVAGNLWAHDPMTGRVERRFTVPGSYGGGSVQTQPAFEGNVAYVIASPTLFAVDLSDGHVVWKSTSTFIGDVAVSNCVVLARDSKGLHAFDAKLGTNLWSFASVGSLASDPIIAAGYAYIANSNNVYAVDIARGMNVWSAAVGGGLSLAEGMLFVAGESGKLTAFALTRP
jgi:outer membrane protein assembly factor BamB